MLVRDMQDDRQGVLDLVYKIMETWVSVFF